MYRNKPFTDYERQLAIAIISKKIDKLSIKKADNISIKEKMKNWEAAANEFNNSQNIQQIVSAVRLKKFWANLKMKARYAKIKQKQKRRSSDDPPQEPIENIEVMPTMMTSVKIDSDFVDNEHDTGDDDAEAWVPKQNSDISQTSLVQSQLLTSTDLSFTPSSSQTIEIVPSLNNIHPFPEVHLSDNINDPSDESTGTNHAQSKKSISFEDMKIKLLQQQYKHNETKFELEISQRIQLHEMEMQFRKQKYELILNNLRKIKNEDG